jgi:hypothetical protein
MPCLSETVRQAAREGIQEDLHQQFMGVINEYDFRADFRLNSSDSLQRETN